jgi:hypothetical protein
LGIRTNKLLSWRRCKGGRVGGLGDAASWSWCERLEDEK